MPEEIKDIRWQRFMEKQQEISAQKSKAKIGQVVECIVDDVGEYEDNRGRGADARSKADAPDIDGTVYLRDVPNVISMGDIVSVKVEDADDYDLYGVIVQ